MTDQEEQRQAIESQPPAVVNVTATPNPGPEATMQGLKNLFLSKKASLTIVLGVVIGGLMSQGLITNELGAQLLALMGAGYSVGQGMADRGGGGGASNK